MNTIEVIVRSETGETHSERFEAQQVTQEVVDRRQTQQRDASACGVAQWGQRQTGMAGS